MRCPKCNLELNPLSERCPNCGTSAKLAVPDGDTMTRVRRQIAVVRREPVNEDENFADASFSPVLKFDKPSEDKPDERIDRNPADNFPDESFPQVDIGEMIDRNAESEAERQHRSISASIRHMARNKEDDLLAAYYFKDGISDLEEYQLRHSYAELEKADQAENAKAVRPPVRENIPPETPPVSPEVWRPRNNGGKQPAQEVPAEEPSAEEMSEAARRLNTFPEESGIDKVLTSLFEKKDAAVLKLRQFFERLIFVHFKRLYNLFDAKTAPFLDKLLDRFYYRRFHGMKRKREDNPEEKHRLRRRIWSVCAVLLAVLLVTGVLMMSLLTDEITGQWVISYDSSNKPDIIMEFTPGGGAVISVRSDDGWHVHKQGRYTTRRSNGHDLLTITYEDGTVSRLYYVIDGRSGTFINVETNVQSVYRLK